MRLFDYLMDDPILSKFFVPFIFEDYPATGRSTSTVYLKEVEKSDIYLGILGDEYGFQNKAGLSPTEQEYNLAHKLHKDCLIYIKRDSSKRQAKEKTFIQKVEADVVRRTFDNYEELKAAVYKSLALYLEEKELFRLVPFDQAKDNEATIKDISDDKIKSFIELSKQKRNFRFKENISATDLLTHLSLMDESGHLTNAAILLFGKKPQKFFISSEVKCMQFYGNEIEKPIPSLQIYKGGHFPTCRPGDKFRHEPHQHVDWHKSQKCFRADKARITRRSRTRSDCQRNMPSRLHKQRQRTSDAVQKPSRDLESRTVAV